MSKSLLDDFAAQHEHHVGRQSNCLLFNARGRAPRKKRDLKWLSTKDDHQMIIKMLNSTLKECCTTTVTSNLKEN